MKQMVIVLLILWWIGNVEAQVVTQLEEARITYSPGINLVSDLDYVDFQVKESYAGQFSKNPIRFVQENFNIKALLEVLDTEDLDEIQVSFVNRNGFLKATFDKEGNLVKTVQKFKNISLPGDIREQVYKDNKGWSITRNIYVATGKGPMIQKEKYRIRLKNGSKNKNIKIIPALPAEERVTGI